MEDLIRKAQGGCRESVDLLVAQHRAELMSFLGRLAGKRLLTLVEVEDLYQDTSLRAFEAIKEFEYRGVSSFLHWLRGIAKNVIKNRVRQYFQTGKRNHNRVPVDPSLADAGAVSPSHRLRKIERLERLQRAFNDLPKDYREAIILARLRRLPIKEVASRMRRSPEAVSMLLTRAHDKLKQRFGDTDSLSLPSHSLDLTNESGGPL